MLACNGNGKFSIVFYKTKTHLVKGSFDNYLTASPVLYLESIAISGVVSV